MDYTNLCTKLSLYRELLIPETKPRPLQTQLPGLQKKNSQIAFKLLYQLQIRAAYE